MWFAGGQLSLHLLPLKCCCELDLVCVQNPDADLFNLVFRPPKKVFYGYENAEYGTNGMPVAAMAE